jgi:hypothetical protein
MPITSFTADPQVIKRGSTSKLSWTSEGCSDFVILPPAHGEPVEPNSSLEVSPTVSMVYLLEGKCAEEPNQWTVLVQVENP